MHQSGYFTVLFDKKRRSQINVCIATFSQYTMNECLTTPQHKKQIGYWLSEKGKCNEMVIKLKTIKKHSVKSCAIDKSITV